MVTFVDNLIGACQLCHEQSGVKSDVLSEQCSANRSIELEAKFVDAWCSMHCEAANIDKVAQVDREWA